MTYIVEALEPPKTDYSVAYHIIGAPQEVRQFRDYVASLTLEAMQYDLISEHQGDRFMRGLALMFGDVLNKGDHEIEAIDAQIFADVLDNNENLTYHRMERLITKAGEGALTTAMLYGELDNLRSLEGLDGVMWVTKEGYPTTDRNLSTSGKLSPYFEIDYGDVFGEDSLETRTARALGANAFVAQLELVFDDKRSAKIQSKHEHTTVGKLRGNGEFEPIATVLSEHHPLRAHSITSQE